ncbi:MAG: DivIVA domain-containing protein [Coriobacteriales bacterium]|jgi:cell division initiation protein|nr:DivIVA domain-containing protein [Coriobacteriales bacterium]
MPLTAADVQQQSFGTAKHGYNPQEVDVFLEHVAEEVDSFNRAIADAQKRAQAAEQRAQVAEQRATSNVQTASAKAAATEEQISKAFVAAQKSADALKEEARRESEKTYREAEGRARDVVREALGEKQRILAEIDRLRESCEDFRADYLALLKRFSSQAEAPLDAITTSVPDTKKERKETEDALNKIVSHNDAAYKPAPVPASSKTAVAQVPISQIAAQPKAVDEKPAHAEAAPVDDELDIDELD